MNIAPWRAAGSGRQSGQHTAKKIAFNSLIPYCNRYNRQAFNLYDYLQNRIIPI
jgi:hypothetical protein